jgi:hypothetical protein
MYYKLCQIIVHSNWLWDEHMQNPGLGRMFNKNTGTMVVQAAQSKVMAAEADVKAANGKVQAATHLAVHHLSRSEQEVIMTARHELQQVDSKLWMARACKSRLEHDILGAEVEIQRLQRVGNLEMLRTKLAGAEARLVSCNEDAEAAQVRQLAFTTIVNQLQHKIHCVATGNFCVCNWRNACAFVHQSVVSSLMNLQWMQHNDAHCMTSERT